MTINFHTWLLAFRALCSSMNYIFGCRTLRLFHTFLNSYSAIEMYRYNGLLQNKWSMSCDSIVIFDFEFIFGGQCFIWIQMGSHLLQYACHWTERKKSQALVKRLWQQMFDSKIQVIYARKYATLEWSRTIFHFDAFQMNTAYEKETTTATTTSNISPISIGHFCSEYPN